jgi:aspartyl aminopeptidase
LRSNIRPGDDHQSLDALRQPASNNSNSQRGSKTNNNYCDRAPANNSQNWACTQPYSRLRFKCTFKCSPINCLTHWAIHKKQPNQVQENGGANYGDDARKTRPDPNRLGYGRDVSHKVNIRRQLDKGRAITSPANGVNVIIGFVCPQNVNDKVPQEATSHILDLRDFVVASPSSFHACAEIVKRTKSAGFTQIAETDPWDLVPGGRYVVVRDGAVVAFVIPASAKPTTPFTIIGTHTDSPGLKLKPRSNVGSAGFLKAGVEIYGSPLLYSWLDRELEFAGRIVTKAGTQHLVRSGPMLRVPQLAIHLQPDPSKPMPLERQNHMQPVWGLGDCEDSDVLSLLLDSLDDLDANDVGGYDLISVDTQPPRQFGKDGALFASGRLDNLLGTHASVSALLEAADDVTDSIAIFAAFDHEEIGSQTRSGAEGTFLDEVLHRIARALGGSDDEFYRSLANSWHISCDVGHGLHPNYPQMHDPNIQPLVGKGPILKINANQRYATDAVTSAYWHAACDKAGVQTQEFVSNNDVRCGSTTGPITAARLGLRTVDVGVPILAMHSAREMCSVVDPWYLRRAMSAAFTMNF